MSEVYVTMLSCSECRRNHGPDGGRNDDCDCWCHDGDVDDECDHGDDDNEPCSHCGGEWYLQECDDPIQCCDPRCDGTWHPCTACQGTGQAKNQVIW